MEETRLPPEHGSLYPLSEVELLRREVGRAATLTAFERRTMELFAAGLPRREIAHVLKRAPKTISNSLTMAKEKLGARSLAEAALVVWSQSIVRESA